MPAATDFDTFVATLQEWANRADWSVDLVTSFIRDAEAKFNSELRVDRMIQPSQATIAARCAPLPDDWLEMDLVMMQNTSFPSGFMPMTYKPRAEFFDTSDDARWVQRIYTIEGRQIYFGGPPDTTEGQTVQLYYYAEVPVFSETIESWIYDKYQSMYRYAALMNADLHAIGEEQTSSMLKQLTEDMIQKLNAAHRYARASGSRLGRTRIRSFG